MSKVKGKFIENDAITSEKIADGSVDTIDLKDGAVTMDKLSSTVQTTLSELQNDLDTKAPKLSPTLTTPTTDVISLTEQSSSPATPASGTKKFYAKNDGKLYSLDSDGNEKEVGAGSGGINLESSPYAQDGENDWATFDDGATATGVDLTGGTATATFAADKDDTSILSGDFQGAYKLTFTAADHQGEGAAKAYSIPKFLRDKGYVLVSSLYSASAAIATGDMILAAYDVTNSELITIGANEVPGVSANGTGKISALIPIKSNTASLRVGFMRAVTTATAFDFAYSDFRIGPPSQLVLPPMHKQAVVDLTGSGDFTAGKLLVTRNGGIVSIINTTAITCSSTVNPESASGIIPDWALPHPRARNIPVASSSRIAQITVNGIGGIGIVLRDFSGTAQATTGLSEGDLSVTYPVEDNSSNIVDAAEVGITPAAATATGVSGAQTSVTTQVPIQLVNTGHLFRETLGALEWESANYGFRVKRPIKKLFASAQALIYGTAVNDQALLTISKNNATAGCPNANHRFAVAGTNGTTTHPVSGFFYNLVPGDLITLQLTCSAGTSVNTGSTSIVTRLDLTEIFDLTAIAAIAAPYQYEEVALATDPIATSVANAPVTIVSITVPDFGPGSVVNIGAQGNFSFFKANSAAPSAYGQSWIAYDNGTKVPRTGMHHGDTPGPGSILSFRSHHYSVARNVPPGTYHFRMSCFVGTADGTLSARSLHNGETKIWWERVK